MNRSQSNKLSMFDSVIAVLRLFAEKIALLPILATLRDEFFSKVALIKLTDQEIKTVSAGKTNAKDEAKEDMIDLLYPMASSLYVYAKRSSNEQLKALTNLPKSSLFLMRENDLAIRANLIKDAVVANKTELADYLVTNEKIIALTDAVAAFENAAETKDSGFASRTAAREALLKLFDEVDDLLLDEIDGIMETFKTTEPDFYNAYFSARVIKDLGTRKVVKENPAPANPA